MALLGRHPPPGRKDSLEFDSPCTSPAHSRAGVRTNHAHRTAAGRGSLIAAADMPPRNGRLPKAKVKANAKAFAELNTLAQDCALPGVQVEVKKAIPTEIERWGLAGDSHKIRLGFRGTRGGLAGDSQGTRARFGGLAPKSDVQNPRFRGTRARPLWAFIILKRGVWITHVQLRVSVGDVGRQACVRVGGEGSKFLWWLL